MSDFDGNTPEGELPFGMNRRQLMKYFGGGLGAGMTGLAGCNSGGDGNDSGGSGGGSNDSGGSSGNDSGGGGGGNDTETRPFPIEDPETFEEMELRWTTDNSAGPLYDMFGPTVAEETNLSFNSGQTLPADNYYSSLNSDLISGDVPYDIVLNIPLYLGDFQARELFEPLDDYLAQYEGAEEYLDSIIEPYRRFYMEFDGDTVALPIDGDIHNLFYRPTFFQDETHQEQYMDEYGEELRPPETWPEFNQVAKYFTENTEDGVYGAQVYGARPFNFGWWMDRAASRGVVYFNEDMEPQINSDDGVAALENMVETAQYAPEGSAQFGIAETVNQWQQGNVVMSVWWIDLSEFTARGDFPVVGDQRSKAIPGWEQDDGSIRRNAMMLYNRLYSIPASLSQERKDAAFYAILRLARDPVLTQAVADPYTGLDPSNEAHYTEEAAQYYTEANPLRETGEGFPDNVPIFSPDTDYVGGITAQEQALQHIQAGQTNMENGFPQPQWPGATQYTNDLSVHIQRALTGEESPQEALDNAAEKWQTTVEELGRESQRKQYMEFLETARDLDYV
jgi:multiple sugar transport system substrate-binding protein